MTEGYHYPYIEYYTPAKIQVEIDKAEKVAREKQGWLNNCLLHEEDTHITDKLLEIKQCEALALEYRTEFIELPQKERGQDLMRKRAAAAKNHTDCTERASTLREELSQYIRNSGNDVVKDIQVAIDNSKKMALDLKADMVRRENVLRAKAERDSLHRQEFAQPGAPSRDRPDGPSRFVG